MTLEHESFMWRTPYHMGDPLALKVMKKRYAAKEYGGWSVSEVIFRHDPDRVALGRLYWCKVYYVLKRKEKVWPWC